MIPPRLEYALAFDEAAAWLGGFRAPFLCMATSSAMVDAALLRAGAGMDLVVPADLTQHARDRLGEGVLPGVVSDGTRVLAEIPPVNGPGVPCYAAALWASPRRDTWHATLRRLGAILEPGALLCVLAGTIVGDVTRRARRGPSAGEPIGLGATLGHALRRHPWSLRRTRPMGGAGALAWAVAARAAAAADRPDLADRAEGAHHLAVESATGAAYVLLLAERVR